MPDPAHYPLSPPENSCSNPPCLQSYTPPPPSPSATYDTGLCKSLGNTAVGFGVVGAEPGAAVFGAAAAMCNITGAAVNGGAKAMAQQTASEALIKTCSLPFSSIPTIGALAEAGCGAAIDAIKEAQDSDKESPCGTPPIPQIQRPCPQPGPQPQDSSQTTPVSAADSSPPAGPPPQSPSSASLQQNLSDLESDLGVDSPDQGVRQVASAANQQQHPGVPAASQLAIASQNAAASQTSTTAELLSAISQTLSSQATRKGKSVRPQSPSTTVMPISGDCTTNTTMYNCMPNSGLTGPTSHGGTVK